MPGTSRIKLLVALADLETADAPALRRLWHQAFGAPAPPTLSARVMRLALAWEVQATRSGREERNVKRSWSAIEKRRGAGAAAAEALQGIAPAAIAHGTRLVKDWGGETHELLVGPDGIAWRGQNYRSLSAVAKAMTGVPRNGPKFFGLRGAGPGARRQP